MTNEEIQKIALQQSAYDCNCSPEDFLSSHSIVTESRVHPKARKYLPLPFSCDLVSYGNNIVAQTTPELEPLVRKYIQSYPLEHCFETPNLHILDELLRPHGLKICFMAEYFLPDVTQLKPLNCGCELRILHQEDFHDLYKPEWSNALCADRRELDVLGVGAYHGGTLVGLAGCSADCEMMYQIGVDVLPEYRRQGIAAALTSRLALEILKLGKVPFYCAAWCNLKSVRNAIKCGFRPAWVEVTARESGFVDNLNRINRRSAAMLNYPCLVLDHDDTVVQSMKTLSYPFFVYILEKFRPGAAMSLEDYILQCHNLGFMDLCRKHFHFTDAELADEHEQWMDYIRTHTPDAFPGVADIIRRQRENGGLICVVSHSSIENITRDYRTHFGLLPDAIYGWDLPPHQRKPNPYPLEDIMTRYDLKPDQILVVDDMKLAWMMAHPLGVKVAYANWGGLGVPEVEKEMRELCDFTFDTTKALEHFLFEEV